MQHAGKMLEILGSFLDTNEVVQLTKEARDGLGRNIYRGANWDVVRQNRQIRKFLGHRFVPNVKRLLRRARIVWRNNKDCVGPCLARCGSQLQGLIELGRASPGNKGNAVCNGVGDRTNSFRSLADGLGTWFASRSTPSQG